MHLHGVIACSLVCIYPFLPFAEPLYSIKRILGTLGTDTDGGPQVCFFTFYFFLKKNCTKAHINHSFKIVYMVMWLC